MIPWFDHCDEDFAQSWGGWDRINGGDPKHATGAVDPPRAASTSPGLPKCDPCNRYFGAKLHGRPCPQCQGPLTYASDPVPAVGPVVDSGEIR